MKRKGVANNRDPFYFIRFKFFLRINCPKSMMNGVTHPEKVRLINRYEEREHEANNMQLINQKYFFMKGKYITTQILIVVRGGVKKRRSRIAA